jgi:DNA topoisomerase VI subunit B
VDNSLDACEEAGILPDIAVVIEDLQPDRPASAKQLRYRVTVVDNGPGIVRKQVENIFGRLLLARSSTASRCPRPAGHRHLRRGHVRPDHHRQARW